MDRQEQKAAAAKSAPITADSAGHACAAADTTSKADDSPAAVATTITLK